jgi:hypothetical protein
MIFSIVLWCPAHGFAMLDFIRTFLPDPGGGDVGYTLTIFGGLLPYVYNDINLEEHLVGQFWKGMRLGCTILDVCLSVFSMFCLSLPGPFSEEK